MPIERDVIRKNILEKGFKESSGKRNPDHEYYHLYHKGKLIGDVWIKLSRGPNYKEYSNDLLGRQAKMLHINNKDFQKFVTCEYTKEEFIEILLKAGKISNS